MRGPIEPGVYKTLDEEEYHPDMALGSSGARRLFFGCPSRFEYERRNPPKRSDAMDFGNAAHEALLFGSDALDKYAIKPEGMTFSTNAGKAWRDEAIAEGKEIIKRADVDKIVGIAEKLSAHPIAAKLLTSGDPEISIFWECPRFGVRKKARFDFLPDSKRILVDLKTCASAHPDEIQRSLWNYAYFVQAAWYLEACREAFPGSDPAFAFVAVESEPPYPVTVYQPTAAALGWGETIADKASEIFRRCSDAGVWPDYVDDIIQIDLPVFGERKLQERHEAGAFEIAAEFQRPLEIEEETL